jgi:hypothetical protein
MELGAYCRGEEDFFKEVCRGELHSLTSEGFLSQRGGGFYHRGEEVFYQIGM